MYPFPKENVFLNHSLPELWNRFFKKSNTVFYLAENINIGLNSN